MNGHQYEFRILRDLFHGKRPRVIALALLGLVSAGSTLTLPLVGAGLVASIQQGDGMARWVALMVAVALGSAIAGTLATYLLSKMGQELVCSLRIRTMRHALGLRLQDAKAHGTGNLASRLTADAAQVKGAVDIGPLQLPLAGLTMLGTLVIMGILDWVLLLITAGAFVVALSIVACVIVALRRVYFTLQKDIGMLAQQFVAALGALTIIKACRAERHTSERLAAQAERVLGLEIKSARFEALMVPVINLGQQIALVSVVIGGGARVLNGQLTLPAFVAFLLYLLQLTAPIIMTASGFTTIQQGIVAKSRFNEVFSLPLEHGSAGDAAVSGGARGSEEAGELEMAREPEVAPDQTGVGAAAPDRPVVEFEAVTFSYDDRPALDEVDITVPPTGLTAVVGMSGAGKTTLLNLIERFMEPAAGEIRVLGRPAAEWPLHDLRGQIAYVDQAFTLLLDTVRNNLILGREETLSDEQLFSALASVGLDEEIRALPAGLDTVLGGETDLSGGQRQRLALARALIADVPLVVLDEPSSQLDSVNEQRLRDVVDRLAADRAVLVVAHRLSTVQNAVQVVVLDEGRLVAKGTHDELVASSPEYVEFLRGQALAETPDAAYAAVEG